MEAVMNQQKNRIHPHKFTLWVAIASILMMFAGLTSAFIVKSNLVGWRQIDMPKIFWVSTAVIILSSLMIQMALRSFRQREMSNYRWQIALTVVLGIVFHHTFITIIFYSLIKPAIPPANTYSFQTSLSWPRVYPFFDIALYNATT